MPTASYPGVHVQEIPSGTRTIAGVDTSTALFIGWAARGPLDEAIRVKSFADFASTYGGLDARSLLGYSLTHFFDNGGHDAYVLRVAHAGDDGLVLDPAGPNAADFNSAVRASVGAGSVTDRIDLYNLVCVPGLADGATVAAVQQECRRRREIGRAHV